MFIWWGSSAEVVRVCPAKPAYCPVCESERPFCLFLRYEYTTVYSLFGYTTDRSYQVACDGCQRGMPQDPDKVERRLGRVPVPFMHRFGCLVGIGIVVFFVVLASMSRTTQ